MKSVSCQLTDSNARGSNVQTILQFSTRAHAATQTFFLFTQCLNNSEALKDRGVTRCWHVVLNSSDNRCDNRSADWIAVVDSPCEMLSDLFFVLHYYGPIGVLRIIFRLFRLWMHCTMHMDCTWWQNDSRTLIADIHSRPCRRWHRKYFVPFWIDHFLCGASPKHCPKKRPDRSKTYKI